MDFHGRTALVTGASSGIGRAFAEELADRGGNLVLVARSAGALTDLARRLHDRHNVRAEAVPLDLTRPDAAQLLRNDTDRLGMTIDVLINNAGFGSAGPFHTISADRCTREIALDVAAIVGLTHAYLPDMVSRGQGAIVNVASTGAFQPVPYMAVYGASKAFVLSFSQALWAEYRPMGIRVLAVCPGPVDTNFFAVVGSRDVSERMAMGRPAPPEAVVRATMHALERGRFQVTPGLANATLPALNRLLPRRMVLHAVERLYRGARGNPNEPAPRYTSF